MAKAQRQRSSRLGRNDPCFCGSGRKFKKCHLPHQQSANFKPFNENSLPPGEWPQFQAAYQYILTQRSQQRALLEEIGIYINLVQTVSHQGRKFYVQAGGIASINKENATFHEILIYNLQQILGVQWWNDQVAKSWDDMHHIARCFKQLSDTVKDPSKWEQIPGNISAKIPDGYAKDLTNLAFDMYVLTETGNTPPPDWIERLKSYDQFEGKRYEISVASIFARVGCKLEYLPDIGAKSKHAEFKATLTETGNTAHVEAKARSKAGTKHNKGTFDLKKATKIRIIPLINEALKKETDDQSFFIFIDANFPENLIPPGPGKHWTEKVIDSIGEHLGKPTPAVPFKHNMIAVTNYSYHYDDTADSTDRNTMCSIPVYSAVPFPDDHLTTEPRKPGVFSQRIIAAVRGYGLVPNL